jgi:hypothetical protein
MTTRDELIEAGADALSDTWTDGGDGTNQELAAAVLDAVERLIRADERAKWLAYDEVVTRDAWSELHAKVSALPEGAERRWNGDDALIWRSDVLDLIDGGSDD